MDTSDCNSLVLQITQWCYLFLGASLLGTAEIKSSLLSHWLAFLSFWYIKCAREPQIGACHHAPSGKWVRVWWCANGPLTRYVKLRVTHAPGMRGTVSAPPTSKETASWRYTGMHYGTSAKHVPWCLSALVTCGGGENIIIISVWKLPIQRYTSSVGPMRLGCKCYQRNTNQSLKIIILFLHNTAVT